jgi:hypothetical protein
MDCPSVDGGRYKKVTKKGRNFEVIGMKKKRKQVSMGAEFPCGLGSRVLNSQEIFN